MLQTKEDIGLIKRRLLWVNERVLRTWVADLIETQEDACRQLTALRADVAALELAAEGWRALAERRILAKPLLVNPERESCNCGGIGCLSCLDA